MITATSHPARIFWPSTVPCLLFASIKGIFCNVEAIFWAHKGRWKVWSVKENHRRQSLSKWNVKLWSTWTLDGFVCTRMTSVVEHHFRVLKVLHTANPNPVSQFSQGKPCFHYREPLFSLQGPCFHYRDFPVNPCTSLLGIAVIFKICHLLRSLSMGLQNFSVLLLLYLLFLQLLYFLLLQGKNCLVQEWQQFRLLDNSVLDWWLTSCIYQRNR